MDEDDFAAGRRREEAAQWFARLKTLPVSQGTLKDFFAWRRQRENAEAFEEAERFWSEAEKVGERPAVLRAVGQADARARNGARSRGSFPRTFAILVVSIAVALFTFAAVRFLGPAGRSLSTGTGEQQTIALADGSRLNLNVETAVRVNYSSKARTLVLQGGEALFTVAHDKQRPFTVKAGTVTVVATGTRFDVARRKNGISVTLIDGSVTVSAADGPKVWLRPGQQWLSSDAGMTMRAVRTEAVTAWTQGRVVFDDARLTDALAEINRYGGKLIVLDAAQHGARRISGSFEAGDTNSFVTAVTTFLPLQQRLDAQGRVHLIAQDSPSVKNYLPR